MSSDTNHIILPTQLSDFEAVQHCGDRAFGAVSFRGYLFPESRKHLTPPDELAAWRADRLQKVIQADDSFHFKCVSKSDHSKVVGYAAWYKPGHFSKAKVNDSVGVGKTAPQSDLTAQAGPDGVKPLADVEEKEEFPACMDVEAHRRIMQTMDVERKKIWGDDADYWYLGSLAVDPDYQGRGLARMLVDMGLEWADADGVPTYVEASPEAAKMYPRFGFKTVTEHGFFGGEIVCEFQVRQPSASQSVATDAERQ